MSSAVSATSDANEEYGSFDPGSILKGTGDGESIPTAASASPMQAAERVEPKAPADAAGKETPAQAVVTKTPSSAANVDVDRAALHDAAPMEASSTGGGGDAHMPPLSAAGSSTANGTSTAAANVDRVPVLNAQGPTTQDPPVNPPPMASLPRALFDASALYTLASQVDPLDSVLATRLRNGATDSVIMDAPALERLHADFNAANKLVWLDGSNQTLAPAAAGAAKAGPSRSESSKPGVKKGTGSASSSKQRASQDDDDGVLGDSESSSEDEPDELPPPDGLLSSAEEVSASLQAVIDAVNYAGPRREGSARPTGAQTQALAHMTQHIRSLTQYVCSRLGFSEERALRNVADMVPSRLGNGYNLFRTFLKCTDPDYKPRRDLDELLGCKAKYPTAECQSLYLALREKLGQDALDELLLDFDFRYPYGVPDPTRGDRERSFDTSADRVEKLFGYLASKLDIEGFFCMVGANPIIDKENMTRWHSTFHARRFLALKLFLEEVEIKNFLQTEVQNSVNNTRAAEKAVAQGRTLPLIVDLNDALGRSNKTAAAPQVRRKGRGIVQPKINETYFDVVREFEWSKDKVMKGCAVLLSGHKKIKYIVSMPLPDGVSPDATGIDFNCEFTVAELEIAIIKFRKMFEDAGIPLPGGRGFPLAIAFQMLIRKGYMIVGWPAGVYIYNESRNKTSFDGLGWPMKCMLVMYILCDYLRICKADPLPIEYIKTLPPLETDPFRIVCLTDAVPDVKTIHKSFVGTRRVFFDNEIVVGLHTTLVSRAIPTIVPRPDEEHNPWKGVHAWNEMRRAQDLETVNSDDDVPFTADAREDAGGEEEDENAAGVDGEAAGNAKGKGKGKAKATPAPAARKKSAARSAAGPTKVRAKRSRGEVSDSDGEGGAKEQPKKKQRTRKPAALNTDDEQKRLRALAMRKQTASNTNPFPQPPSRGNRHYEPVTDDDDAAAPSNSNAGLSAAVGTSASAPGAGDVSLQSGVTKEAHAGRPEGTDSGSANVTATVPPAPRIPAATVQQRGGAVPARDAAPPLTGKSAPKPAASASLTAGTMHHGDDQNASSRLVSPRRSQRQRGGAPADVHTHGEKAAALNKDGDGGEAQHSDSGDPRPLTPTDPAAQAARKAAEDDSDEEYQRAVGEGDGEDSESESDEDEDEDEDDAPSTSRKKRSAGKAASKPRARVRAPASSAAPVKVTGKRSRAVKARLNEEDDDNDDAGGEAATTAPAAKRMRRTRKFTYSTRVPKGPDYDFLFTERIPLANQDGIVMKIKGKDFNLPQALASNPIIIAALDHAARELKLNPIERAVVQYVYDVWPKYAKIGEELNKIFRRNCKD